jgi:uncharacterized protein YkwD
MHLYPPVRILFSTFVLVCSLVFGCAHAANAQEKESSRPVARLITDNRSNRRGPSVSETSEPVSVPVSGPTLEQANPIERRAFEQTNAERAKNGLPPLGWDPDLCRMARSQSERMAKQGYLSHSLDGLRLRERARAVGIAHYAILGENIAYNFGYEDPGGFAVERWMLSPGHRANILEVGFKGMAVGTFVATDGSVFLTQTFITR